MTFLADLQQGKILIFDGGMGSQMEAKGFSLDTARMNLQHPQVVADIHREYLAAGANCLLANTFALNPLYMATHQVTVDMGEANRAGVKIALTAAANGAYVFGDLGPTGLMLEPYGPAKADDVYNGYLQQATVLAATGIDGFMIETMFNLQEALLALKACRAVSALPVIVSLTFSTAAKGGRTMMGDKACDAAQQVADLGGNVVGANCGDLTPTQLSTVLTNMQGAGLPLIAQPNAGKPQLIAGQTLYTMEPADFARGIGECIQAGAKLVGGCCGTNPDHIRAVADLVANL